MKDKSYGILLKVDGDGGILEGKCELVFEKLTFQIRGLQGQRKQQN